MTEILHRRQLLAMRAQDDKEDLDPTPIEIPDNMHSRSLEDQVRGWIREEFSKHAEEQGFETFEEANDFEMEDEDDFVISPFQIADEDYMEMGPDLELEPKEKLPIVTDEDQQDPPPAEPKSEPQDSND